MAVEPNTGSRQPPRPSLDPELSPGRTLGFEEVMSSGAAPPPPPAGGEFDQADPEMTMCFDNVVALPPPPKVVLPQPAASATWHALPGVGLEDYELGSPLGSGPVGACYHGRRRSDGEPVVVKLIDPRFAQLPELLQRMLQDLSAWKSVPHPHLANVLATGASSGRHVVVFERAAGVPLDRYLREAGSLPPSKAVRVVFELGQALAEAQLHDLHHGDIRSSKVYFDGERASLADPGFSGAVCVAAGFGQHGLQFGHPAYLAPEVPQEQTAEPNGATDVYALGILLYEMVCGKLPFVGEPSQLLRSHLEAPLPPPPPGTTFNIAIAALILKMTAKSPALRVSDAGELIEAIVRLLSGEHPFPPKAPPSQQAGASTPTPSPAAKVKQTREVLKAAASLKVEEFDLDDLDSESDGPDTLATWRRESKKAATHSGGWNVERIGGAEKPGQKDKAKGKVLELRGRRKESGGLVAVVASLLAVLGVGGLFAIRPWEDKVDPPEPKSHVEKPQAVAAPFVPTPGTTKLAEQRQALREKTELELQNYQRQVEALVDALDYKGALRLASSALSAEVAATADAKRRVDAMRGLVQSKAQARVSAQSREIDAMLAVDDFVGAELKIEGIRAWIPNERSLDRLISKVKGRRLAKTKPVRELSLNAPLESLASARRALRSKVRGESMLFAGGGLYVRYPSGKALASDLRLLRGGKNSWTLARNPAGSGRVVRIKASDRAVIISSRVPLSRLVDVKATIRLLSAPKTTSKVAILVGSIRGGHVVGRGLVWGTVPVELTADGELDSLEIQQQPRGLPAKTPIELNLKVSSRGGAPSFSGDVRWDQSRRALQRPMQLSRNAKTILLYVKDADLVLSGLEIRGLVDPRAVEVGSSHRPGKPKAPRERKKPIK